MSDKGAPKGRPKPKPPAIVTTTGGNDETGNPTTPAARPPDLPEQPENLVGPAVTSPTSSAGAHDVSSPMSRAGSGKRGFFKRLRSRSRHGSTSARSVGGSSAHESSSIDLAKNEPLPMLPSMSRIGDWMEKQGWGGGPKSPEGSEDERRGREPANKGKELEQERARLDEYPGDTFAEKLSGLITTDSGKPADNAKQRLMFMRAAFGRWQVSLFLRDLNLEIDGARRLEETSQIIERLEDLRHRWQREANNADADAVTGINGPAVMQLAELTAEIAKLADEKKGPGTESPMSPFDDDTHFLQADRRVSRMRKEVGMTDEQNREFERFKRNMKSVVEQHRAKAESAEDQLQSAEYERAQKEEADQKQIQTQAAMIQKMAKCLGIRHDLKLRPDGELDLEDDERELLDTLRREGGAMNTIRDLTKQNNAWKVESIKKDEKISFLTLHSPTSATFLDQETQTEKEDQNVSSAGEATTKQAQVVEEQRVLDASAREDAQQEVNKQAQEIERLREQLGAAKQAMADLKATIQENQETLQQKQEDLKAAKSEVKSLSALLKSVSKHDAVVQKKEEELKAARAELEKKEALHATISKREEELQQTVTEKEEELQQKETELKAAMAKIRKLEVELGTAVNLREAAVQAQRELSSQAMKASGFDFLGDKDTARITELEERVARIKAERELAEQKRDAIASDIADSDKKIASLDEELHKGAGKGKSIFNPFSMLSKADADIDDMKRHAAMEKQEAALRQRRDALIKERRNFGEDYDRLGQQLEALADELEAMRKRRKFEADAAIVEASELKEQLASTREELKTAQEKSRKLADQLAAAREEHKKEATAAAAETSRLKEELDSAQQRLGSAQESTEKLSSQLDSIQKERNEASGTATARAGELSKQLESARQEVASSKKQAGELSKQLESLRKEHEKETDAAAARASQLEKQLDSARQEVASAKKQAGELTSQLESIRKEHKKDSDAAAARASELERQLKSAQDELASTRKRLTSTQDELASAKDLLGKSNSQLEALQKESKKEADKAATETRNLQEQVKSTQKELASSQERLAATQERLTAIQGDLASAQHRLTTARLQLATTRKQLASTQQDLGPTRERLAATEKQLEATMEDLKSAQERLAATEQELASVRTQFEFVQNRLKSLHEQLYSSEAEPQSQQDREANPTQEATPAREINIPREHGDGCSVDNCRCCRGRPVVRPTLGSNILWHILDILYSVLLLIVRPVDNIADIVRWLWWWLRVIPWPAAILPWPIPILLKINNRSVWGLETSTPTTATKTRPRQKPPFPRDAIAEMLVSLAAIAALLAFIAVLGERRVWLDMNAVYPRAYINDLRRGSPYHWWFPVDVDFRFLVEPWRSDAVEWVHRLKEYAKYAKQAARWW